MNSTDDFFDGLRTAHLDHEPQVMIVDDVTGTRTIIKDMLEQMGFTRICEAINGRDALEKLEKDRAQLIICDHSMEEMTGLELLSMIRNYPYLADVPFIMISSHKELELIEGASVIGAAAYIPKPVNYDTLRTTIINVLQRRFRRPGP